MEWDSLLERFRVALFERTQNDFAHALAEVPAEERVEQRIDGRVEVGHQKRERREERVEIRGAAVAVRPAGANGTRERSSARVSKVIRGIGAKRNSPVLPHLPSVKWQIANGKRQHDDDEHSNDAAAGAQHVVRRVRNLIHLRAVVVMSMVEAVRSPRCRHYFVGVDRDLGEREIQYAITLFRSRKGFVLRIR